MSGKEIANITFTREDNGDLTMKTKLDKVSISESVGVMTMLASAIESVGAKLFDENLIVEEDTLKRGKDNEAV